MTDALLGSDRHGLRSPWARAAAGVLFFVLIAVAASVDAVHEQLSRMFSDAAALIQSYPAAGKTLFILFAALSAMLMFVSSAVLVPVAVYAWGATASLLLLLVGWILGGIAAYGIGRYLGRPVVVWLASRTLLSRYEQTVSAHAPLRFVVLFQLALPSELPGYLLGLARYDFPKYVLALAIAETPYAIATVYLGSSFLERRPLTLVVVGIGIVLIGGVALLTLRRRLSAQSAGR